jgi:Ca2+-transporting ATPase
MYVTAQGKEVVLDQAHKQEAMRAADSMAQEGLRVLGFASGASKGKKRNASGTASPAPSTNSALGDDEQYRGLVFAGLVGMNDPPRKGVERAIRRLMAGKVKVIMITGDAETTAVAIGKSLGMPIMPNSALGRSVIRGDELDQMSEEELAQAIATTSIFARTSPEHKMKIVRALQSRGDVVAMTGDGVNDAPALKKADIGISMGRLGTDVAKEAADMILTDDNFATILNAIEEGKGIFYNIQNFLTFQLSTSAAALSLVLLSTFLGFQNPLNAMQILWISELLVFPSPPSSINYRPRHPYGRPTRAIARCRTCRSSRHGPTSSPTPRPRPNPPAYPTRPPIRHHHHARHPNNLLSRNVHRQHRHCTRHNYDFYLLCPLRHVQRTNLPLL